MINEHLGASEATVEYVREKIRDDEFSRKGTLGWTWEGDYVMTLNYFQVFGFYAK